MRTILFLFIFLIGVDSFAKVKCKDYSSKTPEQMVNMLNALAKRMLKNNFDELKPSDQKRFVGKWYTAPKGNKYRQESNLFLSFIPMVPGSEGSIQPTNSNMNFEVVPVVVESC